MTPRRLVLAGTALGVLVAVAAFIVVMSRSDYRLTGTNSFVVPVHVETQPGEQICAAHVFVPAGSGSVAPWAGGPKGAPGGPVDVTIRDASGVVASGRSPASYPTGVNRFPLAHPITHDIPDGAVCFRNRSQAKINFYGDWIGPGQEEDATGNASGAAILRIDWYTPDKRTWWQTLPHIADRFPLFKAPVFGAWTFWLAMAVVLAISGVAVARMVREARP